MFKKYGIKIQLTIYTAILLLTSNILLLVSFYFFINNFDQFQFINMNSFIFQSIGILLVESLISIWITYVVLSDLFICLNSLSSHMNKVNKQNIVQKIEINSKIREVESLINSFNSMMNKIEEAFNTQKNFSNYIAHELRTPLAAIQMDIGVYKHQQKTPLPIIDDIEFQIDKMTNLVNKILELTKIQQTKLYDIVLLDLLFEELFDDLERTIKKKKILFDIQYENYHNKHNLKVLGDHTLLYQAFLNMLENSIKYNQESGKIFIYISDKNNLIKIKIKDSGYGIKKEDSDWIFEPFYREKHIGTSKKGYGIGLAITKKVIEHHGGNIYCNPQEKGSEFDIFLPKYS
ncbi:Signal transduction histidine kinase [Granulicatella balaenopterae]|uniref:histidine kinase n=1 Tax=Granulicatella balaenopterae TaxID=137733 RepID=A0A1H9I8H8_9LACT|nr:HAMP domain-containing sensor histidine kinase [Granulicatella balaenopterae]SEQ71031.1 Signal transduction histidine kinase [Granulicatella balaenopterae]